jgi:hypothetical protein
MQKFPLPGPAQAQRSTVEIADEPFTLQSHTQKSRSERSAEMIAPFAPIQTGARKSATHHSQCGQINSMDVSLTCQTMEIAPMTISCRCKYFAFQPQASSLPLRGEDAACDIQCLLKSSHLGSDAHTKVLGGGETVAGCDQHTRPRQGLA